MGLIRQNHVMRKQFGRAFIAVLRFVIAHVEKMFFGLSILLMAVFLWGAFVNRGKFDKTPAALNRLCDVARRKLQASCAEADMNLCALPEHDYRKIAQKITDFKETNYLEKAYRCRVPWDQPIFEQHALQNRSFNSRSRNMFQ